jgi:hypothetical protein
LLKNDRGFFASESTAWILDGSDSTAVASVEDFAVLWLSDVSELEERIAWRKLSQPTRVKRSSPIDANEM